MLEKIGLPAKPSLRGNNWVVDASHCQACCTQFTFINRKHHCRRCGGLFCNSCTQQRMVLRGQGDSLVRICEPCKKIEEATRFERRHGHKSKVGRGDVKLDSHNEDPALNQILDDIAKESLLPRRDSTISIFQRASSSASCSKTDEVSTKGEDLLQVLSGDEPNHLASGMGSATPDELRQQALDEKNKYKLLKGEGKPGEALKAFKRGKELERQAAAMEIYLRKSRKNTFSTSNTMEVLNVKDDPKYSDKKTNRSSQMGKDKDDLTAELKELGWSDIDASKKPANMSLEGELFTLIGESSQNTSNGTRVIDKTEVIALKKKALTLKREGKLAEAKEELKRAKILEKQLEEQEFLGDAEDSDDELSLLIQSMDDDKKDDLSRTKMPDSDFDFNHLMVIPGDLDATFEVTDGDMDDPEIAAALNSLGWTEDSKPVEDNNIVPQFVPIDREALLSEILTLKKEALNKKRAGNTADALTLLKKAKLLERDLDSHNSHESTMLLDVPALIQDGSLGKVDKMEVAPRIASKSKIMIQRELLGLKKKALTLKREGRLDEAEEELKKAKVFEQQLEDIDNNVSKGKIKPGNIIETHSDNISIAMDLEGGGEDEDINDQDLLDPAYLSVLKNLGWKDEDNDVVSYPSKPVKQSDIIAAKLTDSASTKTQTSSNARVGGSKRSKGELQRELLGLKRKALALRRQGQTEEADEVLNTAKELEDQIAEMETPKTNPPVEPVEHHEIETIQSNSESSLGHVIEKIKEEDIKTPPSVISLRKSIAEMEASKTNPPVEPVKHHEIETIQRNSESSLGHVIEKIKEEDIKTPPSVISLRKSIAEMEASKTNPPVEPVKHHEIETIQRNSESSLGHVIEKIKEEDIKTPPSVISLNKSIVFNNDITYVGQKEQTSPNLPSKPLSGRDRFKLQQQSLGHKRASLKLRREGRIEEAEAEFKLAKDLETQLEESAVNPSLSGAEPVDNVGVEGLLDPQLLSALKAIGIEGADVVSGGSEKQETKQVSVDVPEKSSQERIQLSEQIKAEKIKAVNLKRSGKKAEALDALRRAKVLEKKLVLLD